MIKSTLDPACTGLFSPLFLDYLKQKDSLKDFYHEYPKIENFEKMLKERVFGAEKREVLVRRLWAQYGELEDGPVSRNIQSLIQGNTFTVTTGHQLNLMTGPLYFIYKIVSTIRLAEELKEHYPDYSFVPVYWMASEDHDFAEINHFLFDGKKYVWETDQKGPVGEFYLDKGIQELVSELDFLPGFLKEAYQKGKQLKDAVRKYVHHLFSHKGLVILDGNDKALKQLFIPVIKDDVFHQNANELVNASNVSLEKLGYKTQVFPREINFFYMKNGLRERIIRSNGVFEVINQEIRWQEDELLEEIENFPDRFSPNVVMRPLYQETILPNLAYLGGPAEVAYWFQLKKIFDFYKVGFPFVLPRNFVLITPVNITRKIRKLGLSPCDLFKDVDLLRKQFVKTTSSFDLDLPDEKSRLSGMFDELYDKAGGVDKTLQTSVKAAGTRAQKTLQQVAEKFRKAEEKKKSTEVRRLYEIKETLFPGNTPQERKLNFLQFYLEDDTFIDKLYRFFDPLDFNFIILSQDEIKGGAQKTL
ncbi:bacillithiol biosynthesis cysteine-adding enzyme BshC [Negadavirga shengliensis]|uniref:Putative cysteine ligase BshC n=1 Tax=Negadavirga shengliensis TaxID=1389218 RepID=A0ABV9T7J6_9BACT